MKSIREGRKLKTNYEKMKGHENLVMTNTAEIAVPKTLLHIDGNGEHKIIKTMTKAGNLTKRDKKPVIKIEPKTENKILIEKKGKTKAERSHNILHQIHESTKKNEYTRIHDLEIEMRDLNLRKKTDRDRKEEILKEIDYSRRNEDWSLHKKNKVRHIGPIEEPFMKLDFKDDKLQAPRKTKKKETKT
jgi:hypothetical protein